MVIAKESMMNRKKMKLKLEPIALNSIIRPRLKIYKTHIETKIKKQYLFTILPQEYPPVLEYGFLKNLLSSFMNVDIGIYLDRVRDELAISLLHRDLTNIKAELLTTRETSPKYSKLKLEYDSLTRLTELISARKTHAYFITLTVVAKGKSYREAEETLKKIEGTLRGMNFKVVRGYYRVWDIVRATLPLFYVSIPYHRGRFVHTDVATACFPFISDMVGIVGKNMILFGINDINSTPVFVDRFNLPSHNMLIFGKTGSGKSYFEKLIILRNYNVNPSILIFAIDPLSENKKVFKALNGVNIEMWQGKSIINPLELRDLDISTKVRNVIAMLDTLFNITLEEQALLDVVLTQLYRENITPVMGDLIYRCKKENKLSRVTAMLKIFEEGSLQFLNRQTNLNIENNIVNFDLGKVPDNMLGFFMAMILDYIYSKIKLKKYHDLKKLVFVDEVHHLWSYERSAEVLDWMARHTRHYNTGITLITQSVNDAFLNKHTLSIMENTEIHLLLYHDYLSPKAQDFYKFVPREERYITIRHNVKQTGYSLGLLRLGPVKVPIRIHAASEEDKFIRT